MAAAVRLTFGGCLCCVLCFVPCKAAKPPLLRSPLVCLCLLLVLSLQVKPTGKPQLLGSPKNRHPKPAAFGQRVPDPGNVQTTPAFPTSKARSFAGSQQSFGGWGMNPRIPAPSPPRGPGGHAASGCVSKASEYHSLAAFEGRTLATSPPCNN